MESLRILPKILNSWVGVACTSASLTLIWLYCRNTFIEETRVLCYQPYFKDSCNCFYVFDELCSVVNCSNTKQIIDCLRGAKKSIDICVFALSNLPISTVIIDAHQRGILIRVVVSNCVLIKSKVLQMLKNAGIEIKYQQDHRFYMHHKYSIVDKNILIHSSMNWTQQATFGNWENVLITNSQSLVNAFSKAFEKTWVVITL